MPDFPDGLQTDNHMLWILIGVSIAMVLTLEAVQTAVEGAWPNQRHPTSMLPHERSAQAGWGVVALGVIIGGLLLLSNLAILVWQELDHNDSQVAASILLAISWVLFVMIGIDRFGVRGYLNSIGIVLPIVVLAMLLVANGLLILSLIDIWPGMDAIRDSLPLITASIR